MIDMHGPDDPPVAGGRDVPELRTLLLDRWRPGQLYHQAALALRSLGNSSAYPGNVAPYAPSFDAYALARAGLWWVTADMTALVAHAAETLPPTTLHDSLLPADEGFVVFAEPLLGHSADAFEPIRVRALLWGVTSIKELEEGDAYILTAHDGKGRLPAEVGEWALTISCYGHVGDSLPDLGRRGVWIPQGRSDWRFGTDTSAPALPGFAAEVTATMEEERRWLAALWLLASQPLADTDGRARAPRPVRRRAERAGVDPGLIDVDVRLIDVRRSAAPRPPDVPGEGGRRWGHRTIVKGHWRQQPYGPARSLRRPTFIAEHIAGPDDKPLVLREQVNVVRSAPNEGSTR